ncbi:META domain-containing protein [Marinobacter sp. R17]|uniref:META domain-containing protein n=1 Tax=Marinobacter sp. R17 TaxID=2484250 RepID=UPI000F4B23AA|nr:META domain-containing protein [Marinobacter sp. R17]ROU02124.1 META domain-containing protein [Marinobacter sp. R17]
MKQRPLMTAVVAATLLAGCASTPEPEASESKGPPALTPGRYVSADDSQTWVFWGNGMYERRVASEDAPPRYDHGQWWRVTGSGAVVAHGGGDAPTMLQIADDDTLRLQGIGQGAATELTLDDDEPEPLADDRPMALCFMTQADAPLAYDPRTMRNWPVTMTQAFPQLESAYRQSGFQPPRRLPMIVQGHWVEGEAPDGGGAQLFLEASGLQRVMDLGENRCPSASLQDNNWYLTHLNGHPVQVEPGQQPIFIRFDGERRVAGLAGCNRFSGPFERRRDDLTLGPLATTRMMCPRRAETEQAFLKVLDETERFAIEGETLFLMKQAGQVLAVLQMRPAKVEP